MAVDVHIMHNTLQASGSSITMRRDGWQEPEYYIEWGDKKVQVSREQKRRWDEFWDLTEALAARLF
jgi:hypothetical protein